jgi:hypothetical protein
VATGILVVLGIAAVHPAAAQIVLGSPADPPRFAIGGGAFDVVPNGSSNKPGVGPTGLALGEYRFGDVLWMVAPFVGAFGTGKGAFYGYGGIGFDINFWERLVATPTAAVGYFTHGTGIDLGAHTEFRLVAERGGGRNPDLVRADPAAPRRARDHDADRWHRPALST